MYITNLSLINILNLILCVVFVNSAPNPNQPIFTGSTKIATRDAPSTRIIDGKDALPGQFPWQAAIVIDGNTFCGGSLISREWILTAGHCVEGTRYQVILGATNWRNPGDDSVQLETTDHIQHESYNPATLSHDIGVIKLPQTVVFTAFIQPILLGDTELDSDKTVTVSGFGKTSDSGSVSDVLRYVDLISISNAVCNSYYNNLVKEDVVCAMAPGTLKQGACNGDSGGGLVTEASKNPVHVGITSFVSTLGCSSGYPGGYARTAYFREWIKSKTGV